MAHPRWRARLALARRVVRYELGIWRSLYRWIGRRPQRLETGAATFGYARAVTPVLVVFIVVSAIEIPVLDLLLPWPAARVAALVLGANGVFWMLGLLASMRVNPHVVAPSGLRVRYGSTVDIAVPWDAVADVRKRSRSLPRGRTLRTEDDGEAGLVQYVAISDGTSVDIPLSRPLTLRLPAGTVESVTELRIDADDPDELVAAARPYLAARSAR